MVQQRNATLQWGVRAIVVLAGVWTLFDLIWNVAGQTSDDYWGIALLILFVLALIVAFTQYVQERSELKVQASTERFPEPTISKFFLAMVCLVPPACGACQCGILLVRDHLGRICRGAGGLVRATHRHRRRIWCLDEPELSPGRNGQYQSRAGHVRAFPMLLVARLRMDRR